MRATGGGGGRAILKGQKKKEARVRKAIRTECSRGRSLLHGQDMGKTQDHRNRKSVEQRLAVGGRRSAAGGWRRLAVGGGWRLVAVGGWWRLAVWGWWSLGAILKGCP